MDNFEEKRRMLGLKCCVLIEDFHYFRCGFDKKEVGTFCSSNADKPFPIYSRDGCIDIIYNLSKQHLGSGGGFTVTYKNIVYNAADEISTDWYEQFCFMRKCCVLY